MKKPSLVLALILIVILDASTVAFAQTAREYYDEIASVNGFNALATIVCFPDKSPETFFVAGRSRDFEKLLKEKGLPVSPDFHKAAIPGADEYIYWQGYNKGVPSAPSLLEKGGDAAHWSIKFDAKGGGGEIRVIINWATLRYRFELQLVEMTQPYSVDGRCEPIP